MNHKERRKLSVGLARAMQKQRKPNKINQQLMRYISGNAPIYFDGNDDAYIEDGYELNPDVYAVVNGITSAAAAVPFVVHTVKNQKKANEYYRAKHVMRGGASQKQVDKALNLKEEAFEEVDPSDDLYRLLERPNPLQAFPEWYENMKGFQLLTGNGYTYANMLTDGRIGEMWIMPSQWTRILADSGSQELIKGYAIDLYGNLGDPVDAELVMHWKYWNPDYDSPGSHLYGMSPLKAARRSLRLGNDTDTALSVALRNGGASGMIFPEDPDIENLTPEQQSQIREFLRNNQNPESYKQFLVFSAKMGYKAFGHPPVDLEMIESGKMSQRDICNVYGYPSELLNDPDNKTNANKEQSRKQLYLDVVIPALERDYAEMNRFITPHFNKDGKKYHIDYDLNAIDAIQADNSDKVDWLAKAYWLTENQKLEEMGFEQYSGGDVRHIPANLIPDNMTDLTDEDMKRAKEEYE